MSSSHTLPLVTITSSHLQREREPHIQTEWNEVHGNIQNCWLADKHDEEQIRGDLKSIPPRTKSSNIKLGDQFPQKF